MPHPTPVELKRALIREGFEIYRTLGEHVLLADRVRDNLIMDSGVAAGTGSALRVKVVVKAQANDFPGESSDDLIARARELGQTFSDRSYAEVEVQTIDVKDPGNAEKVLDTWYEVSFERPVDNMEALVEELHYALAQPKTVGSADDS